MSVLSRRWMWRAPVATAIVVASSGIGCVGQTTYEAALNEAQRARADAQDRAIEVAVQREREAGLARQLRSIEQRLSETSQLGWAKQLQELAAQNAELLIRVQRAERAVEVLATRGSSDDAATRGARASNEELDVRRVSLDQSDDAIRDLLRAIQPLVDAGRIKVTLRDGRVRFQLPRRIDGVDPYQAPGARSLGSPRYAPLLASPDP